MDLRSTGYYKVKQSIKQHYSKPYYDFKALKVLGKVVNKLTNTLETEQQSTGAYPWLAEDDERRYQRDREIFENILMWRHHV